MSRSDLLRDRSLVALLAAELVSTTGGMMTWLALPWFVLVTSSSATHMTFVAAAEVIGLALFGLPGGRLLGRFGGRRTMIACDAVRAPLMGVIPVMYWTVGVSFAVLLAVAFLLGAASAPYFASQKVVLPELLGEDERRLTEANALFQGATRTTMLAGPALGGLLVGVIGAPPVLVIDAASYLVSLLLVAGFVPARPPVPQEKEHRSARVGLRFILSDPILRVWTPVFAFGDAAWTAFFISVPALVLARFGHHAWIAGIILGAFGVGALIGNAVAFRYLARRFDGFAIIGVCILAQAAPLWLLWLHLPWLGLAAVVGVSGIANGLVNPSLHTISTLRVPAHLRPNVFTTSMVGSQIVNPLGLFATGPIIDAYGVRPVLVAFAATQTVSMALIATTSLRELGRRRVVSTPVSDTA